MEWIKVSKKKPKMNQLVIVCNPRSLAPTYGWRNDSQSWIVADEPHYANSKLDRISFVTHWQPLPPPPTEAADD
jgi:hypothetical protein